MFDLPDSARNWSADWILGLIRRRKESWRWSCWSCVSWPWAGTDERRWRIARVLGCSWWQRTLHHRPAWSCSFTKGSFVPLHFEQFWTSKGWRNQTIQTRSMIFISTVKLSKPLPEIIISTTGPGWWWCYGAWLWPRNLRVGWNSFNRAGAWSWI